MKDDIVDSMLHRAADKHADARQALACTALQQIHGIEALESIDYALTVLHVARGDCASCGFRRPMNGSWFCPPCAELQDAF